MFAERMAPVLDEADEVLGMSVDGLTTQQKARIGSARIAAQKLREQARVGLYLVDEDDVDG